MHFRNYRLPKTWLDRRLKSPVLEPLFDSQHVKGSQTFAKSASQHFYQLFSSLMGRFSCKMSLLVTCKILGLFINTMTVDENRFLRNSGNFLQPIQMQNI